MGRIRVFIVIFLLSSVIFLAHFYHVGESVYGDGRYYYSYLPSVLIEHTTNFTNAFNHLKVVPLNKVGLPENPYSIGPAIVWAIPYLLFFILLGMNNPYSILLQIPVGIWNIFLVTVGLFFVYKMLKGYFSDKASLITICILFFGTNLFFYGAVDVLNSHSASFFFASIFTYLFTKTFTKSTALIMGICLGMIMLVRTQDIILVLLPLYTFIKNPKRYIVQIGILIVTTAFMFLPQLYLWHLLWGNWFKSPYLYHSNFTLLSPHIFEVLFNKKNGLFLWTPITLIAFIGLIVFTIKHAKQDFPLLIVFLVEIYVIGSWQFWWEGASYSARMTIATLPVLSFGIAYVFEKIRNKYFPWIFLVNFSLLNTYLIILFLLHK